MTPAAFLAHEPLSIERRQHRRLPTAVAVDGLIFAQAVFVAICFLVPAALYYGLVYGAAMPAGPYVVSGAGLGAIFLIVKRLESRGTAGAGGPFKGTFRALSIFAFILLATVFVFKSQDSLSRGACLLGFALAAVGAFTFDLLVLRRLVGGESAEGGVLTPRLAIVGVPAACQEALAYLAVLGRTRVVPNGLVLLPPVGPDATDQGEALDWALAPLLHLVQQGEVDEVVVAVTGEREEDLVRAVGWLASFPVDVSLCPIRFARAVADVTFAIGGRDAPIMPLVRRPIANWGFVAKRVVDVLVSAPMLIALAPLFALVAAAIKLDSPGPVFFRQRRHGYNHEVFEVWKFRTMRNGADRPGTFRQATRDDSRVTRVGRLLRRTSIDELPQLINVLRGEMSLVGPRPHAMAMNEHFTQQLALYSARHRVIPGITGLAQINGFRGETDTDEKMIGRLRYDLEYIRTWSFWLDIRILALTLVRGLLHPNAY